MDGLDHQRPRAGEQAHGVAERYLASCLASKHRRAFKSAAHEKRQKDIGKVERKTVPRVAGAGAAAFMTITGGAAALSGDPFIVTLMGLFAGLPGGVGAGAGVESLYKNSAMKKLKAQPERVTDNLEGKAAFQAFVQDFNDGTEAQKVALGLVAQHLAAHSAVRKEDPEHPELERILEYYDAAPAEQRQAARRMHGLRLDEAMVAESALANEPAIRVFLAIFDECPRADQAYVAPRLRDALFDGKEPRYPVPSALLRPLSEALGVECAELRDGMDP